MIYEVDLLMEYNKDLSRPEAEKIVEKNKEATDNEPIEVLEEEDGD